ncbi:chaplin, partial [Streptomyces sp. NPDC018957]|uniref:chaplin n=1 Tax=Streptomyces sp. NPDC018957 TaxID=3365056 RepID=UPI00379C6D1F
TDSPGVASGNNLQVPVSVPVNVCGNSADVVGVLNPAFGNSCADGGSGAVAQSSTPSQSGAAGSTDSPGVASGNNLQVPVSVPVNVCGNSADVVGAHNPTVGNSCAGNGTEDEALINIPSQPGAPDEDSAASSGDSDDTSSAVPGDGGDTSSVVPGDGDDTTSVVPGDGGDTTSVVPGDGGDTSSVSRNEQDAEQPVFASVPSGTSPSGESVRTTELDTDEVDPYSTAAEPVSAWSRHTLAETGSANMAAAAVASAALIVGGTAILYRRRPATRRR